MNHFHQFKNDFETGTKSENPFFDLPWCNITYGKKLWNFYVNFEISNQFQLGEWGSRIQESKQRSKIFHHIRVTLSFQKKFSPSTYRVGGEMKLKHPVSINNNTQIKNLNVFSHQSFSIYLYTHVNWTDRRKISIPPCTLHTKRWQQYSI